MKNLIFVILLFISFSVLSQEIKKVKVIPRNEKDTTYVSDGDTFKYLDPESNLFRTARLKHIDAPEYCIRCKSKQSKKRNNQQYGRESRNFLYNLLQNSEPIIFIYGMDNYGRDIVEVFVGHININRLMVASGNAWWYYKYSDENEYNELEKFAKKEKLGLWSFSDPIFPEQFRKNKKSTSR